MAKSALRMDKRWLWLMVPVVGLLEFAGQQYFSTRAPAPAAYEILTSKLDELHKPGDLTLMAPYWAEPNLRRVVGDKLLPLAVVARPDETSFARAIEVSILNAKSRLSDWQQVSEEQVGPFAVRVLSNPHYQQSKLQFIDLIGSAQASVFTLYEAVPRTCAWTTSARVTNGALAGHPTFPAQRYECGGAESHFVGVTVIDDQDYRPRRCIWAAPDARNATVVKFSAVVLGARIHGFGGLSYLLERESKGTPINLEVAVDGQSLGEYTHADGEGWTSFEFSTQAYENSPHDVEFRVSSRRASQRDFCFQADIR